MIQEKLRIMLVENNELDATLIKRQIRKIVAFPQISLYNDFEKVKKAINNFAPDLILCDYDLSTFTGMDVLLYMKSKHITIPIVFVTGTINDEEIAANTILTGASGYILKKHINVLHTKLLPFFKKIVQQKRVASPSATNAILDEMAAFVEQLNRDKTAYEESLLKMKESIEKIKAQNKDIVDFQNNCVIKSVKNDTSIPQGTYDANSSGN